MPQEIKRNWACDFEAVRTAMEEAGWRSPDAWRAQRPRPAIAVSAFQTLPNGRTVERYLECTGNPSPEEIVDTFNFRFRRKAWEAKQAGAHAHDA